VAEVMAKTGRSRADVLDAARRLEAVCEGRSKTQRSERASSDRVVALVIGVLQKLAESA